MRPACFALVLLGCGPNVILDDGTSGETEGSGDDATTSTTSNPGSTSGEPPQTVDAVVSGNPDPSGGFDVPSDGDCWQVQSMFEAPDHVGVLASDQNGDGREELWLFWNPDDGPGPGDTTVFAMDETGTTLTEVALSGFVFQIGDIEGDGLEDLVGVVFDDGPPYFGWIPAVGPASFSLPPLMLDLELGQGLSGFFDISGDGPADVFLYHDDGTFELQLGDGAGGFAFATSFVVDEAGFVTTSPVEGAPSLAVMWVAGGFGGDPECTPTQYRLIDGTDGMMAQLASSDTIPDLGILRDAITDDGGASIVLWADSCVPGSDLHDLRQLVYTPGASTLLEFPAAEGKRWAAAGDFDGDGFPDLAYAEADPEANTMVFAPGNGPQTFGDAVLTTVEVGDVRDNNVRTLDMDGDGRDELVRGTVLSEGNSTQLAYERIFLGPC